MTFFAGGVWPNLFEVRMNVFYRSFFIICLFQFVLTAGRLSPQAQIELLEWEGDELEARYESKVAHLAYGRLEQRQSSVLHPWCTPVKSIGHTIASYQNYSSNRCAQEFADSTGRPSGPYWHHGIDIRVDAGTPVHASAGGKVVNVENYIKGNPAYWEVAILDEEGFLWQYHHIEQRSIPKAVHDAFAKGQTIPSGTKIGEVYKWKISSFGEVFHHIHFNVLGENKTFLNPFALLQPLGDQTAPKIHKISLIKNGKMVKGASVSGKYSLCAEVSDLILHNKYIVPPHSISYELDGKEAVLVWQFDRLPGGSSNKKYIHDFFVPKETQGDYTRRRMVVDLGFQVNPSLDSSFPSTPGKHHIKVLVRDFEGNSAEQEFEWVVEG